MTTSTTTSYTAYLRTLTNQELTKRLKENTNWLECERDWDSSRSKIFLKRKDEIEGVLEERKRS